MIQCENAELTFSYLHCDSGCTSSQISCNINQFKMSNKGSLVSTSEVPLEMTNAR